MPKLLYLMRHAQARPARQETDHERPLDHIGMAHADEIGAWLASRQVVPQAIWCSDALRTATTGEIVASHVWAQLPKPPELKLVHGLYNCTPDKFVAVLQTLPKDVDQAMVVGHNMTISQVAARLIGTPNLIFEVGQVLALELLVDSWSSLGIATCVERWTKV